MSEPTDLRAVLETVRRHVERATAGTGLQATSMTVDLRFGLRAEDGELVRPVLRTADDETRGATHSLRMVVSLEEGAGQKEG